MAANATAQANLYEIHVVVKDGTVTEVRTVPQNPVALDRLLCGRPMRDGVSVVSHLFGVCTMAQASAAAYATEAVVNRAATQAQRRLRGWRIGVEALREQLRLLAIELPLRLGAEPATTWIAPLKTLANVAALPGRWWEVAAPVVPWQSTAVDSAIDELDHSMSHYLWGSGPIGLAGLRLNEWAEQNDSTISRIVRTLALTVPATSSIFLELIASRMEATVELVHRLRSLADDNAMENDRPEWCGFGLGTEGIGEGIVTTARGTLRHRVQLDGDHVSAWNIYTPTDEILREGGTLQKTLLGLPVPGVEIDTRRCIEACITVLDPCVPWRLEVAYRA